jgi:dTDP-4-amino-4,6-dideoxygalactose transaminase
LDSIQAAVLNVKFPSLDRWTDARQANAQRYHELFSGWKLNQVLELPSAAPESRHVWNQYIVRVPDGKRDALQGHLAQRKIGTEIYYPLPLHQQECFAPLGYAPGSLPETERAARETLALPIFPELTAAEQSSVVREIASFFGIKPPAISESLPSPKFLRRPSGVRAE